MNLKLYDSDVHRVLPSCWNATLNMTQKEIHQLNIEYQHEAAATGLPFLYFMLAPSSPRLCLHAGTTLTKLYILFISTDQCFFPYISCLSLHPAWHFILSCIDFCLFPQISCLTLHPKTCLSFQFMFQHEGTTVHRCIKNSVNTSRG